MGEYRKSEFKLGLGIDNSPNQYNNPMVYKFELWLEETLSLNYNHLKILLNYNYTILFLVEITEITEIKEKLC